MKFCAVYMQFLAQKMGLPRSSPLYMCCCVAPSPHPAAIDAVPARVHTAQGGQGRQFGLLIGGWKSCNMKEYQMSRSESADMQGCGRCSHLRILKPHQTRNRRIVVWVPLIAPICVRLSISQAIAWPTPRAASHGFVRIRDGNLVSAPKCPGLFVFRLGITHRPNDTRVVEHCCRVGGVRQLEGVAVPAVVLQSGGREVTQGCVRAQACVLAVAHVPNPCPCRRSHEMTHRRSWLGACLQHLFSYTGGDGTAAGAS